MSARIRVAYDITPSLIGSTGVARYTTELDRALVAAGVHLRRLAVGRTARPVPLGVRRVRIPLRVVHAAWRWFRWPTAERLVGEIDVVHSTDLVPPPSHHPVVMTVHDVAALERPDLHPPRAVALQQAQVRRAAGAAAVIAVSHATARALANHGVDPDRILVAPNGLTRLPVPTRPASGDRYLLGVGELAARKGWEVLIRAFGRRQREGLELVIAGPDGWGGEAARSAAAAVPGVRLLGQVDDDTLASLYAGCIATCVPSWAEGFGFPVLEACGAGVPVLASDLPVLREVGGSAALYVDAGDVDAWADAIDTIVSDGDLRARLAAAGPENARPFTWERSAQLTIDAYRQALTS